MSCRRYFADVITSVRPERARVHVWSIGRWEEQARGAKLLVGEIAWTRLRWRRCIDIESSRVESLSFRNSKQKIHLGSSISRRLTLSGRRISIAIAMHCVLPKQIRGDSGTTVTFSSSFLRRKDSRKKDIRSKFVHSISVRLVILNNNFYEYDNY